MKTISFLFDYLRLRLSVLFGIQQTADSLNFKWRWEQWDQNRLAPRDGFSSMQEESQIEINPDAAQNTLGQPCYEFRDLMGEVAAQAFNNLEEMHKMDILRREQLRKS